MKKLKTFVVVVTGIALGLFIAKPASFAMFNAGVIDCLSWTQVDPSWQNGCALEVPTCSLYNFSSSVACVPGGQMAIDQFMDQCEAYGDDCAIKLESCADYEYLRGQMNRPLWSGSVCSPEGDPDYSDGFPGFSQW